MTSSKGPESRFGARGKAALRPRSAGAAASASLYERYKDALRRGHVAALRGRHDAAIDAYGEAAGIAPDRALPHASIGGILSKMNRLPDAVAAYERALALAPRDEAALRGNAEVLTRLGRHADAAEALDRLAEALTAGGRLADATDTARRALELAESRSRRDHVEALANRLRAESPGDEAAERALALATRFLEPTAAAAIAEAEPETEAAAEPEPESAVAGGPEAVVVPEAVVAPAVAAQAEPRPEPVAEAAPELETEPERPLQPELGPGTVEPVGLGIALGAAAEAQLYAGELVEAREGLLAAARAHRRAGRIVAAVDACDLAIGIAPADPDLHLLLAELYLDRGWRSLAADKLLLLGRIAELDDDRATRERLCALVSARLSDEPRLRELCA
jgi:tetratricopeptide (TPR) repeat protein